MSNPFSRLLPAQQALLRRLIGHNPFGRYREFRIDLASRFLQRSVTLALVLPRKLPLGRKLPLLILNDGQENGSVRLRENVTQLTSDGIIPDLVVCGILAGDRMQEFGISSQPDYLGRGSMAVAYRQFICQELVPELQRRYTILTPCAIAGYSLGGLSAFDTAWHCPTLFDKVGVFSGSFWWRMVDADSSHFDEKVHRLAHDLVRRTTKVPSVAFWLQTGTEDESQDRNGNGIIDSIDDTMDLISELKSRGYADESIRYVEVKGGKHHPGTWGQQMPNFLTWAFGTK
ncbi:MAG: esterase family protein [Cyclobacteriaceae bacterium]|nr:esterase family protein [Cyclobacteriaceae bacterium]